MSLDHLSNADLAGLDRDMRRECSDDDGPLCRHCDCPLDETDYGDTLECQGCVAELVRDWLPVTPMEAAAVAVHAERLGWHDEWLQKGKP
jgi:hypothetical protein